MTSYPIKGASLMRLEPGNRKVVVDAVKAFDSKARVWLFGSRVDDAKRGGDIDIAVLSGKLGRMEQMAVKRVIMDAIGEQKLDIVVSSDGQEPFFRMVLESGVRLDE